MRGGPTMTGQAHGVDLLAVVQLFPGAATFELALCLDRQGDRGHGSRASEISAFAIDLDAPQPA
jgi:hypothetical protein